MRDLRFLTFVCLNLTEVNWLQDHDTYGVLPMSGVSVLNGVLKTASVFKVNGKSVRALLHK